MTRIQQGSNPDQQSAAGGRLFRSARTLVTNPYFWKGLGVLVLSAGLLYIVLNYVVMPAYTRHGDSVTVPDVINRSFDDAQQALESTDLRAERVIMRQPNLPRGLVIDQNPEPLSSVKPGRRVYLTVNSGDTSMVAVPDVLDRSVREARNRIMIQELVVSDVRPDSIPSAHANTITKQSPEPGERVPPGTAVTLWYSTGLGDRVVSIPNVVGMRVGDARERLLRTNLRSVVLDYHKEGVDRRLVRTQTPAEGTSVREGFEVRLRVLNSEGESPDESTD